LGQRLASENRSSELAKGLFLVTNEAPDNRGDFTPVWAGIQKTKHIQ
jgi:hypothetical protein